MKCAIKFDGYLIADVEELTPILKALANNKLYTASNWSVGKDTKFSKSEDKPEIYLVGEDQISAIVKEEQS